MPQSSDFGYKYIARPLYRAGEKLGRETPKQSAKRHRDDAARIRSGKTLVKDPSWPERRAEELDPTPALSNEDAKARRQAKAKAKLGTK